MASPFSRRSFLQGLGVSALGFGLTGCERFGDLPPGDGRPDIVLLVLDSLRARSLSVYGHSWDTTPFLTDLATRSTLFERCYAAATWTRPSVTSILTGLPPLEHRGWRFNKAFPAGRPSFPHHLGEAGYHTGFFTANPAIGKDFGMEEHFDRVANEAAKESDFGPRLTDDCMAWVKSLGGPRPAFVYIHYWPPHGPYKAPDRFLRRTQGQPLPSADHLAHRDRGGADISLAAGVLGRIPWYQAKVRLGNDLVEYQQRYEANIAYADSLAAGFFSRWMEVRGGRRTIFILTSDHGEGLGEHGLMCDHGMILIDEILHVPLILHDSAAPDPVTVVRPVSHLDLGPTILELAGVRSRFGMMNESLLGRGLSERVVLSQEGVDRAESAWALTSGRWRLVYNAGARFGAGHQMEVRSATPSASTVSGTPLAVPPGVLCRPMQIAGGIVLERFALHSRLAIPGSTLRFSGTLQTDGTDHRLAIRFRTAGGPPVSIGPFSGGEFEGEVRIPDETGTERLIVEGARWTGTGSGPPESGWLRVLTAPTENSRRLNNVLEILAVTAEPPVACPGDAIHITLHWRAHQNVGKEVGVLVELVDPQNRVAISEARTFFRRVLKKGAEPRPLVEDWKLEATTFSQAALDFEDSFWWTVPATSSRGTHSVRVGLLDSKKLFWGKRLVTVADPVPMTTLELCESRSESLLYHDRQELGIESLRLPPGFRGGPKGRPALQTLARRFPDQGHLDFLLAKNSQTEDERREHLHECLQKTPFHRSALAELAALGERDAASDLARLTPQHPRPTRFGDVVSLAGFDLCRGDSEVYLTLYWEAEAVSSQTFSGKLAASMIPHAGERTVRWPRWFIGGEPRPTHTWKMGETVVETIRLEIEPGTVELSLQLGLTETWSNLFSRLLGSFVVTTGNSEERVAIRADLGTHRVEEIPLCTTDYLALKRSDPTQCVLVDLDGDPEQQRNLVHACPEVFARLHGHLQELLVSSDSWGRREEAADIELSEETVKQLQALGYLD